ncbi:hypothetical protein [Bacillus gaemokensis]|uniref:Group-specific protein n=1 Tax=Bacillus gaemokensis TaxID=574375 RepID=A0A073KB80_9BACI|nr:hypothetical protein [Bacillus gaemokensis]KEK23717.1 hypothetical protein BAGA_07090 [Bacillus gaemokensis]KYG26510.1 hypothetical protein AZF08_17140 [Bacillus gaemokensis]
MKISSSIRFWIILMSCMLLGSGFFLALEYNNTSKAEGNRNTAPYELLYAKQNTIPLSSSSSKEKRVIKGMIITEASAHHDLNQIAEEIKEQYKDKDIDEITLSIHNKNNGKYEEDLSYEPISKGTLSITYSPQSHSNTKVLFNE